MSQLKIYTKIKQNLKHNCVLQESCKTVRLWQRSILLCWILVLFFYFDVLI